MYFKCSLFLTLAVVSKEILGSSPSVKCLPGLTVWTWHDNYPSQDRSDKLNSTNCTCNEFQCRNGKCIPKESACNLIDDCEDGSDENNCTNNVCESYEFRCQSGQCIYENFRCDAETHCANKSDEENCLKCFKSPWSSTEDLFKCVSSNKCIYLPQLCDFFKNCPDGSDEDEATCQSLKCSEGYTKCGTGQCVPTHEICQDLDPCGDDSKIEKHNYNCTECPSEMFKCETGNKCIENSRLCDTVPDCRDGSDESLSTCSVNKCSEGEFQCLNGQCVGSIYESTVICNGRYDCSDKTDKSDEANCTICSPEAEKCGSGECVHKSNLCNSIVECADGSDENEINCPHGSTPPVLTPVWRGFSGVLDTNIPNVTLQHLTQDMAVYYDSSVAPSVTWPFSQLSQAWKYAKETFGLGTLSEPGSQFLYVVLGEGRFDTEYNFSFRSWLSGYRNVIDQGARETNGWVTQNSANFEILISSLGYIVKSAMEGVLHKANHILCDRDLRNIVFYDIYNHLNGQESADVMRWKANQFNQTLSSGRYNCFRDWFLPVYEKYGGATVLKKYFQIFKRNWPKKLKLYSKFTFHGINQLNVGEFVHFWSGAAGEDLRYLAKSAFNDWNHLFMRQFAKAQTDFPDITYPAKILSGNIRNIVNLNYKSNSGSHYKRSVEGYNKSKNKKN